MKTHIKPGVRVETRRENHRIHFRLRPRNQQTELGRCLTRRTLATGHECFMGAWMDWVFGVASWLVGHHWQPLRTTARGSSFSQLLTYLLHLARPKGEGSEKRLRGH